MKSTQWLGVIATGLVSLIGLSGCSGDPAAEEDEPSGPTGTRIEGTPAYTVLSGDAATPGAAAAPAPYGTICTSCHQPNAQGFTSIAPEIRHTPAAYARWIVRQGRIDYKGMPTGMTPYPPTTTDPMKMPAVTDAELDAIIAWSNGLPKPTSAAGMYQDFCGNCHGPVNPTGGAVPYKIQGLPKATVDAAVRNGFAVNDPSKRDEYMPAFDTTLLTDADLTLIRQYIGSN
jgi:mono/diheme cytochrome c family protein